MKFFFLLIIVPVYLLASCDIRQRSEVPIVESGYPNDVLRIIKKRQKIFKDIVKKEIGADAEFYFFSIFAQVVGGKEQPNEMMRLVRFTKHELGFVRFGLININETLRNNASQLGFALAEPIYWSPIASPRFAAFTTPLYIKSLKSQGWIIEINEGLFNDLKILTDVAVPLIVDSREIFSNVDGEDRVSWNFKLKKNDVITKEIKDNPVIQKMFNAGILYHFHFISKDSLENIEKEFYRSYILPNKNDSSGSGSMLMKESLNFIASHEFSHALLRHNGINQPYRFSKNKAVITSDKLKVVSRNFTNEFEADSLGYLLSKPNMGIGLAVSWLKILERSREIIYDHTLSETHPPMNDRIDKIMNNMSVSRIEKQYLQGFVTTFDFLFMNFEPVLRNAAASRKK